MASVICRAMMSTIETMIWWGDYAKAEQLMHKLVRRALREEEHGERIEEVAYDEQKEWENYAEDAYLNWLESRPRGR